MRRAPRSSLLIACCLATALTTMGVAERDAHADFFSVWGQAHGGYLSGTADRFDNGSQGFFGFAAGVSITMLDVFMDVRMDSFDLDTAGMWNQLGVGISFALPIPAIEPFFGVRASYLYAQFNEGARDSYISNLEPGEKADKPSEKGINISGQAGLNVELVGPLYLFGMIDVGYHILLPDVENAHGINYSGLGGLKLKFGI